MIPQKVIISQQKRVLNLLMSPNPDGFTRMQIANCLGIERATICRRVAGLRDLGLIRVVKKDICPITHEKAEFLTANREVISSLPAPPEPMTEQTGSFSNNIKNNKTMKREVITKDVIMKVLEMRELGHKTSEIAERLGISSQSVRNLAKKYKFYDGPGAENMKTKTIVEIENPKGQNATQTKHQEPEKAAVDPPASDTNAKLAALKAFSSRQLIKELYNRGYRIEKDGLFVIKKEKVLVGDIINEA